MPPCKNIAIMGRKVGMSRWFTEDGANEVLRTGRATIGFAQGTAVRVVGDLFKVAKLIGRSGAQ